MQEKGAKGLFLCIRCARSAPQSEQLRAGLPYGSAPDRRTAAPRAIRAAYIRCFLLWIRPVIRTWCTIRLWPDHGIDVPWPMSAADARHFLRRIRSVPTSGEEHPRYTVFWIITNRKDAWRRLDGRDNTLLLCRFSSASTAIVRKTPLNKNKAGMVLIVT